MDNEFGGRLARILKIKNISQRQFAKMAGITPVTLSRYINGQRFPNAAKLKEIACILEIPADYLLGIEDEINEKTAYGIALMCFDTYGKDWTAYQKSKLTSLLFVDETHT